jgi:anthranilate synthase component 1
LKPQDRRKGCLRFLFDEQSESIRSDGFLARHHMRHHSINRTFPKVYNMKLPRKNIHAVTLALGEINLPNLLTAVSTNFGSKKPFTVFQKRDRSLRNPTCTIIAFDPAVTVSIKEELVRLIYRDGSVETNTLAGCPFEYLNDLQNLYAAQFDLQMIDDKLPFATGMIGYFGFGLIHLIESVKRQSADPFNVPDAMAIIPQTVVCLDHENAVVHVVSHESRARAEMVAAQVVSASPVRLRATSLVSSRGAKGASHTLSSTETLRQSGLKPVMSKPTFISKVRRAKKFIEQGQCFQIVLSQRFSGEAKVTAGEMFSTLLETAPSTYNYLLSFPEFQYIGASPETMVNVKDERVQLCALAGTRPRGDTRAQDAKNEIELQNNEKELAEHRMLVDLGRNDLGKVCVPGSIQVGPIAQVLKYSNVMHLGTEIFGRLEETQNCFYTLKACFPRGTVSGAPKVRAMELLSELEPEQRGIYSGAVGFFDARGYMDTAIAIRSALVKDGLIHVNSGAGIVYDSEPDCEYMETINKASAIASATGTSGENADFEGVSESGIVYETITAGARQ